MLLVALIMSVLSAPQSAYADYRNCPEEIPACPRFVEQLKKIGRAGLEKAVEEGSSFEITLTVDRVGLVKDRAVEHMIVSPSEVFDVERIGVSGRSFRVKLAHPDALLELMPTDGEDEKSQKAADDRVIEDEIQIALFMGPVEAPRDFVDVDPRFHAQFGVAETLAQKTTSGILARERTVFPALVFAIELENQPRMEMRAEIVGAMREEGGVSVPYADLRYTPYFFDEKDYKNGGVNFTPLSGSLTRNVYTSNAFQGRAYLLGFEGRAVHNFNDHIQFYFEAAIKGVGVRLQQWLMAPHLQGSVGAVEARADLALAIRSHESFMVKILAGAWSALSVFPGGDGYTVAAENDTRAYGQVTVEVARLIELFARGSVDFAATTQGANFTPNIVPTVRLIGGVGVVF